MDLVKSLIANVPGWVERLNELSGKIEQRQIELARVDGAGQNSLVAATPSRTKSVRNKGSTESLKPQDEGAAWKEDEAEAKLTTLKDQKPTALPTSPGNAQREQVALQPQTNEVAGAAQARAPTTLRKRNKRSGSVASTEGASPKYRTRKMIIVYYDSYVQSFFEELAKFVSAQRNMMRKARMAAKVAHIKRLAEVEMPVADEDEKPLPVSTTTATLKFMPQTYEQQRTIVDTVGPIAVAPDLKPMLAPSSADKIDKGGDAIIEVGPSSGTEELPVLNYKRTANMRSPGVIESGRPMFLRASGREGYVSTDARGASLSGPQQPPNVLDELDKGLEYVQAMCERAAHQFLRDGYCNKEIESVKRRLAETKELADREMERITREDLSALEESEELTKTRNFRPQSMRKEVLAPMESKTVASSTSKIAVDAQAPLEVDEGIEDIDHDIPKLNYRSTRNMMRP